MLGRIDAWWRAANYLAVGQIYLMANPLLAEPLRREHVKPRLLGHFGTVPGLNLVWAHANRVILDRDLDAVFVAGPGHGGPGPNACAWLEGTYTERYSHIGQDADGMAAFFRQFSFPGGVPSHCAPETPGSFHEGGELGYSLLHATGAALDNPSLVVFCVVGDGEAETGPLATSWHATKFLNPARDGAVLPILQLNEYKIANPTVLARIPPADLDAFFRGHGYEPHVVARRRPGRGSPGDGVGDGHVPRMRSRTMRTRSRPWRGTARGLAMADDRAAHAEGLDVPARRRRSTGRGHVSRPSGPAPERA